MYTHVLFLTVVMTSLLVLTEAWPRNRADGWNLSPQGYQPVEFEGNRELRGDPIAAPLWFLQSGKGKRINVPGAWMMRTSRDVRAQNDNRFLANSAGKIIHCRISKSAIIKCIVPKRYIFRNILPSMAT